MSEDATILNVLDWHHSRRRSGTGVFGVLVGPVGPAVRVWRRWAAGGGRGVALVPAVDPGEVLRAWLAEAGRASDLTVSAHDRVRSAGGPADSPKTLHDLDRLWRELPLDPSDPATSVAYRLLAAAITGRADDLSRSPDGTIRAFAGVCGLLPEPRRPALVILPPADEGAGWFPAVLRFLSELAEVAPELPAAVCVSPATFDAVVSAGRTDRVATRAREGVVAVPTVSPQDLADRLRAAGVDPLPPSGTLDRLTADGLAADVAEAFVEAAAAVRRAAAETVADDFRSVHERFLYEQLESLPDTAGLFRPNRGLPFAHGPRAAEADLLAERLNLVVEVDGSYYHLNQPQYRRDRAKDWLYQKHGYLVLRFLAEDVVDDLPAILHTVREAVALRSAPPPAEVPAGE